MPRVREIFKPVGDIADFRAVVAAAPHSSVSGRYSFIPTTRPLEVLQQLGYSPVAVAEQRVRSVDKYGFQMHAIRLRHANDNRELRVGQSIPELLLINSHMGTASFRLSLALWELVCANGLMVEREGIVEQKVRHVGYTDGQVCEAILALAPRVPELLTAVEQFNQINLDREEQMAFAKAASALRWEGETYEVNPLGMLYASRAQQRAPTLWNTANVLQEHLVRGGVTVRNLKGHTSHFARPITGLGENVRLNKALWVLTEKMAELKRN
jgi:hypothetical protein